MADAPKPVSLARVLAIAILGPLVGTLVLLAMMMTLDASPPALPDLLHYLPIFVVFGWLFGLVPSSLSAFLYRRTAPRIDGLWQRVLACVLIGFVCGALAIWPAVWIFSGRISGDLVFAVQAGLCGAVALAVIALPFSGRA
ncbi:hypothetical protein WH87_17580 [Devosia epidermidihirudinis]|uniref:Uncharacterized protein n=1 Tax=Devosia epidermidihirudinis TaxID=1293439 RepID=A0A0F5Q391_9HYPH|nr:hypothetical protein [Devosia epidermidihirudinis]KKC35377.1 hypothetical protein WH87_17580 [Devosia epidermidihirudinis]